MITLSFQDLSGQTQIVKLDAYTSEGHEDKVSVTAHPVETGVVISDHARDEPKSVFVEGKVSNIPMPGMEGVSPGPVTASYSYGESRGTRLIELDVPTPPVPLSPTGIARAGVSALTRTITGKPKAVVREDFRAITEQLRAVGLQYDTARNRPQEVDQLLQLAIALKAPVLFRSPLREVGDLQITRLAPSRSVEGGQAVLFQVDMQQIRVATSETVSVPVPVEARGAKATSQGAQATTSKDNATEEEKTQLRSTLSTVLY